MIVALERINLAERKQSRRVVEFLQSNLHKKRNVRVAKLIVIIVVLIINQRKLAQGHQGINIILVTIDLIT